jgi:predicted DNA-binding protein
MTKREHMKISNFYISPELEQRIEALSNSGLGIKRSQVIRYCLEQQLPKLEEKMKWLSHDK